MKPEFDVVVIGAGSAGCALAGHLCQSSHLSICVVEAGPDYGPASREGWPGELLDPRQSPATHDWGYFEQRVDTASRPERRAKVVGGCSTHNQCAAVWGLPEDYDAWADAGNQGWSYDDILPTLREIDGIVQARRYRDEGLASWQRAFLESAVTVGFPRVADLSAPIPPEGVAPFHANVRDSMRWNAAFAFLDLVRGRANFKILAETIADRLIWEGDQASALVCRSGTDVFTVAGIRYVLCAGTYGSPAILMRSGVGPAIHLEEMAIPVRANLEGVGRNLHDHPGVRVEYPLSPAGRRALEADQARGALYQSQVILKARSRDCTAGCDLHILPTQGPADSGEWSSRLVAYNMTPQSRGRVLLRAKDPFTAPVIDFQLFKNSGHQDIALLAEGKELIDCIARSRPLADYIDCKAGAGRRLNRKAEIHAFIEANATRYAHAVGTCKMGPASDPTAVVDGVGRVHGLNNVFVADASLMPRVPRANTNFSCFLIGMRIARRLLAPGDDAWAGHA